jgi:hypothetical protein
VKGDDTGMRIVVQYYSAIVELWSCCSLLYAHLLQLIPWPLAVLLGPPSSQSLYEIMSPRFLSVISDMSVHAGRLVVRGHYIHTGHTVTGSRITLEL